MGCETIVFSYYGQTTAILPRGTYMLQYPPTFHAMGYQRFKYPEISA
jgi:hypothetical protein